MNNSNVRNYKDYVEVVNGLFTVDKVMFEVGLDDPEEFTFRQRVQVIPRRLNGIFSVLSQYASVEEAVNHVFADERFIHEREVEIERARIENERLSLHLRDMRKQELLEHIDRIS